MRLRLLAILPLLALVPGMSAAQEPTEGVRVGITYQPGVRPGMLVLGGPRTELLDSVRTIVARDLEFSDEFEIITLPAEDSLVLGIQTAAGSGSEFVNYPLYGALGADFAVRARAEDAGVVAITVYDVRGETVRREFTAGVPVLSDPDFRMATHRMSDEIVRVITGTAGVAATRFLFLQGRRIYRMDADGADVQPVSPDGAAAFSPSWDPRGRRAAYTEFHDGGGYLYLQELATGRRLRLSFTQSALNYTPVFSPDGNRFAFTRSDEEGTDVFTYNLESDCCLQRLTSGRFADNLSPTFSPDGRRIAFSSTRSGLPQIYVMSADGTGQELFAPFDYGVTGSSHAPEWSPDGRSLAFHRDVGGTPQVFVMDVATRTVRQLTSAGRNEDPTWAPDGQHLAFVSDRTGRRQLWVIDLETGRVRQVTRAGEVRLPAWSGRMY